MMTMTGKADESNGTAALKLAKRGFRVFPLFEPISPGVCSCKLGKGCPDTGKHPRISGGLKGATSDVEQITAWWSRWREANVAIATGDGLVVIDIDTDKGGGASLRELEEQNSTLGDDGMRVLTGGGGEHYYFRCEGEVKNSVELLGSGIDIRGEGGYVVAPPSVHTTGTIYEWDAGASNALLLAPSWVMRLARGRRVGAQRKSTALPDAIIGEGGRNDHLTSFAGALRRRGASEGVIRAALFAENLERCFPPLDEVEVAKVAASVAKYEPSDQPAPAQAWEEDLRVNREGYITKDPGNAVLILTKHDSWRGVIGYDELSQNVVWRREPPDSFGIAKASAGDALADWHYVHVQHWITKNTGCSFGRELLLGAIEAAARANTFHPVRDWLVALEWDGVPRLEHWLPVYLGAEDDTYTQVVGRCWVLSAVARILYPGCQADHVLVLESPQGSGKSTGMAALFGDEWYMGSMPDLRANGGKEAVHSLGGSWCVEIAELDAIKGVGATKIKDFISQRIDEYRPPYGRCVVRRPRQCVFVGTTNQNYWSSDPTGARRFWPVKCGTIDREAIARDRAQLWAEAHQYVMDGADWWAPPELAERLAKEQEDRYQADAWEDILGAFVRGKRAVETTLLFSHGLEIEMGRITRADQTRLGICMRRLGWVRHRTRVNGTLVYQYVCQDPALANKNK